MQTFSFDCNIDCNINKGDKLIGSDNIHYNVLEFGGPSMTHSNLRAY